MTDTHRLDRDALNLILGCIALLGLVFALAAFIEHQTPTLDRLTLRAVGRPPSGSVSILLDVTDPLSSAERSSLEEWLYTLELNDLHPNQAVTIWELGSTDEGALRRLYSRYFPGRRANPLWGNPGRVAARCDSLFWSPMFHQLCLLPPRSRANRSPILAAIREVSEQAGFADARNGRELVLVSDLLENSSALSFYHTRPDFRALQASRVFPAIHADLHGVTVEVLYIIRAGESADAGVRTREFWRAYFAACGARSVQFRRL